MELILEVKLPFVHDMKKCAGVEMWHHSILNLVLVRGQWSASWPNHFTPQEGHLVCAEEEACWACQSVLSGREKNVIPARNYTTVPL